MTSSRVRLRSAFLALALSGSMAALFAQAPASPGNSPQSPVSPSGKKLATSDDYVGDEACRSCHQEKANKYQRTAHHLTSQLPNKHSIAGKFSPGSDILETANPNLHYRMEATDKGYFQTAVEETAPFKFVSRKERFELVVGSGRKGQTYLYWKGDDLFELPVSYWTELHQWINSPSYPDGYAFFDRGVDSRCLECHASSFESLSTLYTRYNKNSLVLGITCERCHGPGREHAAGFRSQSPPSSRSTSAIINPAALPRDRQVDLCGLCHGGAGKPLAPALSYSVGDVLLDYFEPPLPGQDNQVDVHGGHVQLFKRSRCFQSSAAMTCSTCHDVHTPQRDAASFAPHCLACHKTESCGLFPKLGKWIAGKCVDCHMPLQESQALVSDSHGRKVRPRIRNHQIGIFPEVRLP